MNEREPFLESALDAMYRQAEKDGIAPVFTVGDRAWDDWDELEETFPEEINDD